MRTTTASPAASLPRSPPTWRPAASWTLPRSMPSTPWTTPNAPQSSSSSPRAPAADTGRLRRAGPAGPGDPGHQLHRRGRASAPGCWTGSCHSLPAQSAAAQSPAAVPLPGTGPQRRRFCRIRYARLRAARHRRARRGPPAQGRTPPPAGHAELADRRRRCSRHRPGRRGRRRLRGQPERSAEPGHAGQDVRQATVDVSGGGTATVSISPSKDAAVVKMNGVPAPPAGQGLPDVADPQGRLGSGFPGPHGR